MRTTIAIAAGIVAACLILFVASPYGGRVSIPPVTTQTHLIETKRFLPAGTKIDPVRDLQVSQRTITRTPGQGQHQLSIPQGALPGVVLDQYRDYVVTNDLQQSRQLNARDLMPPVQGTQIRSHIRVYTFNRSMKAGDSLQQNFVGAQNQPYPWPLQHVASSKDNRFRNNYSVSQHFNGKVLMMDVEQNMPIIENMFIDKAEWQKLQQARDAIAAAENASQTGTSTTPPANASPRAVLRWKRDMSNGALIRSRLAFRFDDSIAENEFTDSDSIVAETLTDRRSILDQFDAKRLIRNVKSGEAVKQSDFE
ncbi:MAG: hypothetical protein Alpg2KO_11130 [Alphaproteobacteria bacterium]